MLKIKMIKKVTAVYGMALGMAMVVGLVLLFISGCEEQRHIEQLNTAKSDGEAYIVESKEGTEWFARSKNHAGAIYFTDESITSGSIDVGDTIWVISDETGENLKVTGDF